MQRRSITSQERAGGALHIIEKNDGLGAPQLDDAPGSGNLVVGVVCALLAVMFGIGGAVCLFEREFQGAIGAVILTALLSGIAWQWTGMRKRIGR